MLLEITGTCTSCTTSVVGEMPITPIQHVKAKRRQAMLMIRCVLFGCYFSSRSCCILIPTKRRPATL